MKKILIYKFLITIFVIIISGILNPILIYAPRFTPGVAPLNCCCAGSSEQPCDCAAGGKCSVNGHSGANQNAVLITMALSDCGDFTGVQWDLPSFKFIPETPSPAANDSPQEINLLFALSFSSVALFPPDKPPKIV